MENTDRHAEVAKLFNRELIPLVYRQIESSCFDEAFETIEDFYNLHLEKDELGWLKNNCISWQALILEKQEKYIEALSLYKSAYRSLQPNDNLYAYKKLNIARVLLQLGNNRGAIAEIEPILQQSIYDSPSELLKLLECYFNCLKSRDCLLAKYEESLAYLGREFDLNLSNLSRLNLSDIREAIQRMVQKNREANQRYSLLVIQLGQVEATSEKIDLLEKYISSERINCYRNLAIAELDTTNV